MPQVISPRIERLHEMAKGWEQRFPGVDIVLIEPDQKDELMFETSMMNFASRVEIARHGFESVTKHLAEEYERRVAAKRFMGVGSALLLISGIAVGLVHLGHRFTAADWRLQRSATC